MTKPKFFTPKFIENGVRFAVYFLAVALTPLLAKPFAPLFDWVGYSLMRKMFAEIFTVLFWCLEAVAFYFIERAYRKKQVGEAVAESAEEAPAEDKKKKKEPTPPLPMKNLGILTGICVVCIFLVSVIIGFKVKPFYDIGEKVTGHELCSAIAVIGRNIVKCLWIVAMLGACKGMAEEIVATLPEGKAWKTWLITGAILMAYGVFDVFVSVAKYPLNGREVGLIFCYLLFYVAFTAVYCFTKENKVKAYCLIMLIYLF